jgi:hypothetical protein
VETLLARELLKRGGVKKLRSVIVQARGNARAIADQLRALIEECQSRALDAALAMERRVQAG